jgi:hypothetical protein
MVMVPTKNLSHYYIEMRECEHTAHSALNGTLQGVLSRSLAATDERASLRGEYEKFLIPHTPSDVIYVSVCPSAGGLGRRRERQPILRTGCPDMLAQ